LGYVKKAKYDTLEKQLDNAEADLKAAARQQVFGMSGLAQVSVLRGRLSQVAVGLGRGSELYWADQ